MKTTFILSAIALFFLIGVTTVHSQGRFNKETYLEFYDRLIQEEEENENAGGISIHPALSVSGIGTEWSEYTVGGSAGFGWNDNGGNSDTTFCFGAEFLAKVIGEDENPNGAGYLGAFGSYHTTSSDNFKENILRAGVKFSYFDRITSFNEAQLIYGIKAFYDTGSQEFSSVKDDINGYGISAYTGVNFRLCDRASIGVELPVISYLSRTFENNGNEFETDNTTIAINKDNPAMAYFRYHLGRSKLKFSGSDIDGDGIDDREDKCPEVPGLPENDGCPDSN